MMLTPNPSAFIMVGMSGGVDSSVAAYLLKQAGHKVMGVFMKNWEEDDTETHCHAAQDLKDAAQVCDKLNIPFESINFSESYWQNVFTHFLNEYQAGRTPNPDILCNKEIKFAAFLNFAKQRGADFIATGHYAQRTFDHETLLLKAADLEKDQSYFLHALTQAQLSQSLFPIGHLTKTNVRQIAKDLGLINHDKKDSTGICFIGERKFKTFLNDYLKGTPGLIETHDGEVIGQHDGLIFHTIGQRQGLNIGGSKGKLDAPWYVLKKDLKRNVLIVVQGNDHPLLKKNKLITSSLHWINEPPKFPASLKAKIRYRQHDQECLVTPRKNGSYVVTFSEPQRAVTEGQYIVFYDHSICLGGGIIESTENVSSSDIS